MGAENNYFRKILDFSRVIVYNIKWYIIRRNVFYVGYGAKRMVHNERKKSFKGKLLS